VTTNESATETRLLEQAATATGLSNFGEHQDFRIGLRVLIGAADDAGITGDARDTLEAGWVSSLSTRLLLIQLRQEQPAIAAEEIAGPLAVIGLPRTGTTALVDLLAQDPAARAPMQWETANLFPPPSRTAWASDPRIAQLQAVFDETAAVNPIVKLGQHTFGAMLPDECNSFLTLDFRSPNLSVMGGLPRYSEWLRHGDVPRPYATHRMVLQHLQHHGPAGRWTLKSPFHCFNIPQLLAEYPDAMLVQTHRDPVALMPSMCGLYSNIRGETADDPERSVTGRELVELWGAGLQRGLAARLDPAVDARVFDVSHRSMLKDPLGTVRSVYDHFDLPFTADAESAMQRWLDHPSQHMSSVKFTLEEFGLDPEQVEAGFGAYRARFGHLF
jgi:hypothetical protein